MEAAFEAAERVVSRYFAERRDAPERGTIEVHDQRYVLVRAAALSVEFFNLVRGLYGEGAQQEADEFARNILFDLAHAIGKSDARSFHEKMQLVDPIERLSAGPVHFAHAGWAFVEISPDSRPSPDENFYLLYDHPYSFEANAWLEKGDRATFPVCVMNAGYSSGWCQESFGVRVVAAEICCRARGDEVCRFVMAHPNQIEAKVSQYRSGRPELRHDDYQIPDFFSRKRMEEELRRNRDELEERVIARTAELAEVNRRLLQAQKLEAVGRLAGGIAHDFNNLLALVLMRTSLLQGKVAPSSSTWQELDEIRVACERGAALSKQLLSFSRRQPVETRPIELASLMRELERTLMPLVGEDVEVKSELRDEAHIVGDRSQLEQVVMNLVVNARDAMPTGGVLTLAVDVVTLATTTVTTGELPEGSYARLRVTDTGSGMDAETVSQIFDPFFTTKPDEHGTGLGLSTVYGIVKQAGGGIAVESAPRRGTTFTIYWPTSEVRARPTMIVPAPAETATVTVRILLVEDQEDLRTAIGDALLMAGHDVITAEDAETALALLDDKPFDVLLTDLVMPRMSGRVLAERVRARWPNIQILFMSGYDPDQVAHEGTLLRKPFSIGELEHRIEELARRARNLPR
jgi:signal transduction histidine kinase/predicted hydrocarbon binding protein